MKRHVQPFIYLLELIFGRGITRYEKSWNVKNACEMIGSIEALKDVDLAEDVHCKQLNGVFSETGTVEKGKYD